MIFKNEFKLDHWSRFWLAWAIGLNIFFGAINILVVNWGMEQLKLFIISFDLLGYLLFVCLAAWGIKSGRTGAGIYSVFIIFGIWIGWGLWALYSGMRIFL